MTKEKIRKSMLIKRFAINKKDKKKLDLEAVNLIKRHKYYKNAKRIGIYHPIKNELDITKLLEENKAFYLPRVVGIEMEYIHTTVKTKLTMSKLRILEPKYKLKKETPELLIVPALAVDNKFNRVGYGKGFFDRYIKNNPKTKTLAIVIDFQVMKSVPKNNNDMKVHDIIVVPSKDKHEI